MRVGNMMIVIALKQNDILTNNLLPEYLNVILSAKRPISTMDQQIIFAHCGIDAINDFTIHILNKREASTSRRMIFRP